jgi:hypothetical protein
MFSNFSKKKQIGSYASESESNLRPAPFKDKFHHALFLPCRVSMFIEQNTARKFLAFCGFGLSRKSSRLFYHALLLERKGISAFYNALSSLRKRNLL